MARDGDTARIGVYVCHCGGNISDVVDVQRLVADATRLSGVVLARNEVFMCSDPGQNLIIDDIKNEGLNRIVVASCSPKLHESTFRSALARAGLNPYLYENVNIREQVSWATHDPGDATRPRPRPWCGRQWRRPHEADLWKPPGCPPFPALSSSEAGWPACEPLLMWRKRGST